MKKNAKKNLGVVVSPSPPFALDFCWGCIPSRQIGPNSQTMMMRFTIHTTSNPRPRDNYTPNHKNSSWSTICFTYFLNIEDKKGKQDDGGKGAAAAPP